jgi:nitrite reductase (NADH) small subunit
MVRLEYRLRHEVGSVDDFVEGEFKIVQLGSRSIGVVKTGGSFYAVLNVCPHERAPVCRGTLSGTMLPSATGAVEYGLQGRILRCPWHGYEFDLAAGGRAVFTSYKARLRMFPVTIDKGKIIVETA